MQVVFEMWVDRANKSVALKLEVGRVMACEGQEVTSFSARCSSPTQGALRDVARLLHDG